MPTLDEHQSSEYTKRTRGTLFERFNNHIGAKDPITSCIPWLGCKDRHGYGRIMNANRHARQPILAHRVAWEMAGKILDPKLIILHRCNNPSCVNVDHLEQGTQKQNMEQAAEQNRMKGPRKFTKEDYDFVKQKVAEGFLKKDIAFDIGCSPALITKILNGSLKNADVR